MTDDNDDVKYTDENIKKVNEASQNFSFRKARNMIRKFHINTGDVILLKHGTTIANEIDMSRLADALSSLGIDAIIAVVKDFDDLTVLNEIEMNKHGWVKTRTISKLFKPSHLQ